MLLILLLILALILTGCRRCGAFPSQQAPYSVGNEEHQQHYPLSYNFLYTSGGIHVRVFVHICKDVQMLRTEIEIKSSLK